MLQKVTDILVVMIPPKVCSEKMGARRSALGWGSLLWTLGKIEWSAGRTRVAWVKFSLGGRRMALGGSSLVNFGVPLMRLVT